MLSVSYVTQLDATEVHEGEVCKLVFQWTWKLAQLLSFELFEEWTANGNEKRIAVIKPEKNTRGDKCFGRFFHDILADHTDVFSLWAPSLQYWLTMCFSMMGDTLYKCKLFLYLVVAFHFVLLSSSLSSLCLLPF